MCNLLRADAARFGEHSTDEQFIGERAVTLTPGQYRRTLRATVGDTSQLTFFVRPR